MEDVFQKLDSLYVLGENVLNLPDDFEIKSSFISVYLSFLNF